MVNEQETSWLRCLVSQNEVRKSLHSAAWILVWALSFAAVSQAIKRGWLPPGAPTYAAIVMSAAIGLGMVLGFRRFLREADELQRKIQLDALAISLGVTVVGAATYRLIERVGVVAHADVANIILLVSVTYTAAVLFGQRRYA